MWAKLSSSLDNLPSAQLLWNPWMKHVELSLDKNATATLLTLQLTPVLPVQLNAQCSLCHRVHGYAALEDSSWDHHTKQHNNCRINEWNRKLYTSRSIQLSSQIPIHCQADEGREFTKSSFFIANQHFFKAASIKLWIQTGVCKAQKKRWTSSCLGHSQEQL